MSKNLETIFVIDTSLIERKLDRILLLMEKQMGQLEDLTSQLDTETNAIAARLDTLAAQLANGQPPKPETIAALTAISARLKTLGADPAAPIPPAVATP